MDIRTAPLRDVRRRRRTIGRDLKAGYTLAEATRRAELDAELQAMDATVIQVRDLGAALEAREIAQDGVEYLSGEFVQPWGGQFDSTHSYGRRRIRHAVRLARVALGEVSS